MLLILQKLGKGQYKEYLESTIYPKLSYAEKSLSNSQLLVEMTDEQMNNRESTH